MRPQRKLLNIAVLMVAIMLQACGMPSAEPRAEVVAPTPATAAVRSEPARSAAQEVLPAISSAAAGGAVSSSTSGTEPGHVADAIVPERWKAETLLARVSNGLTGYDMANGQTLFHLPSGRLSADGKQYVTAALFNQTSKEVTTQIGLYDPAAKDGPTSLFVENGPWALGAVSANGHWAALTRIPAEAEKAAWTQAKRWQTELQVFDTLKRSMGHTIKLDGNFEIDALSNDGFSLFLIEHVPAIHPEHYRVRLYNLLNNKLQEGALVDKGSPPDEVMTGYAWGAVGSPDGNWLLTLYLDTQRHSAFVHALNLQNQYAICVDLPSGSGDFSVLKQFALTLAPTANTPYTANATLYASNAALGVVAHITFSQFIGVARTERFSPQSYATPSSEDVQSPLARSIVSRDGTKLYFSSGWDVWGYDTQAGKFDGPILSSARIAELGLSADGARLYLAREQLPLSVISTASGAELRFPATAGP